MTEVKKDPLKPFKQHGVVFKGVSGSQAYGDCPFTGKENKFYVNRSNLLWDSKTAGISGNITRFLEEINLQNQQDLTKKDLIRLALNRGLPSVAFKDFEIGKSSRGYTFPLRNEKGNLLDLRTYRLGKKSMGTSGCFSGIFNLNELVQAPTTYPVYLCEGEWDTIAMRWLLKENKAKAIAVGVPGANVFKREWSKFFKDRDVIVCFDNDEAGENGELTVKDRLTGVSNSIFYLQWPARFPTGYDIRDLVKEIAVQKKMPKKAFKTIDQLLRKSPRKQEPSTQTTEEILKQAEEVDPNYTIKKVEEVYRRWLFLKDFTPVEIAMATVISNELPGDPIWMFLVAPSGGCKTEILQSFNKFRQIYLTSSLTPHSLISGMSFNSGEDPSLIPKLDGKTLIIKDFTVILNMRDNDRDSIISILRDAYDGSCAKDFGSGKQRTYKSHFSILSGVTPLIYNNVSSSSGFGERWTKYYMGDALEHENEKSVILKAMGNVVHEEKMREELGDTVNKFLLSALQRMKSPDFKIPIVPDEIRAKLTSAVQYAARMRGTVTRSVRENDMITSKPFREVGSRLGKQSYKLLLSLAIVRRKEVVTEDEYRVVVKTLLDTVDQRAEEMVRKIYLETPTPDDTVTVAQLRERTSYTAMTIRRVMDDLTLLGVVKRMGAMNKYEYCPSDKVRILIEEAGIYKNKDEAERGRADEILVKTRQEASRKIIVKKKRPSSGGRKVVLKRR